MATTLVWREGLDDWVEAKRLKELEVLFRLVPPPLSKEKIERNLASNTSQKIKDDFETQKTKTKVAKEIKLAGKLFIYSIILGLLSYPFFAYKGFKAIHLKYKYVTSGFLISDYNIGQMDDSIKNEFTDLIPKDDEKRFRTRYSDSPRYRYKSILDYHIDKMKNTNIMQSIKVLFVSFFIMILGRYLYFGSRKGVNWVAENSKKDI